MGKQQRPSPSSSLLQPTSTSSVRAHDEVRVCVWNKRAAYEELRITYIGCHTPLYNADVSLRTSTTLRYLPSRA